VAFRRQWWLAAGIGAAAVVVVVTIVLAEQPSGSGSASASGSPSGDGNAGLVSLSAAPLGVNTAPWDDLYSTSSANVMQPLLAAAGIKQLRYGGGAYADLYDWQTNTDIGNCLPDNTTASFTSKCSATDVLDFAQFSQRARAIGADSLVTVNYGSGTPALAAAWVTAAERNASEHVALWEVGNETYGCWEVNNELADAPANYKGYRPGTGSASGDYQSCPETTEGAAAGTKTLATSYAVNALKFMKAMKEADPAAVIGVPWAFGSAVSGGGVADNEEWNNTVLGTDGADVGFVDAHYYPFTFSGSTGGSDPSDSTVLQALKKIPSLDASMKAELAAQNSKAAIVIGETSLSSSPTTTVCTPAGAVFAAGDALSWLASGAQSVDWWDMNNFGNSGSSCTQQDFGLFNSATTPVPYTSYYGYLLAAKLAQPGARLGFLTTSGSADVLAYQSVLPGGKHAVAFINLDTSAAHTVTFSAPDGLSGTLNSFSYSAGAQTANQSRVVAGTTSAASIASGISLPAESITVLETQ